jgi:hypothetical protein
MFTMMNYWAILTCALFSLILECLWYAPVLFGRSWTKAAGIKQRDCKSLEAVKGYLTSLIAAFIQSMVLATLIINTGTRGISQGICIGAATGAGLVATTIFTNDAYEDRHISLSLINAGYRIVYFIVIGAILGAWQ